MASADSKPESVVSVTRQLKQTDSEVSTGSSTSTLMLPPIIPSENTPKRVRKTVSDPEDYTKKYFSKRRVLRFAASSPASLYPKLYKCNECANIMVGVPICGNCPEVESDVHEWDW